ncbi:MAG: hypothetical protein LH645_08245 [Actinomycetia bacterium]|nr:hypothetical protein [Actinomycetes bacterium]
MTADTFSVDLGVLVVARGGVGGVVTPPAWSAGCSGCGVRAEAVSTGLVLGWTAPTMSLKVATFSVVPGAVQPFGLLDVRPVGRLFQESVATAPAREAFSLVVDDFEVGGPAEIAVAWGADCGDAQVHLPCSRLSFFAMDDAERLALRSSVPWGADAWCNNTASGVDPSQRGVFSIAMASGHFQHASGVKASPGADLAIGWVAAADPGSNETGDVYHLFQAFDVTSQLTLAPTVPLDVSDPTRDPGPCATVTAHHDPASDPFALRSNLQIAAGDVDGAQGDEIVVAETLPNSGDFAPVSVSLWGQNISGQGGAGWRPQVRRQPVQAGWDQPFTPGTASTDLIPAGGYVAVGDGGSGQVSLAMGRLARRQADASDDLAYPNAVNPDIVVGWTCNDSNTCGASTTGDSVAVDAFAVSVDVGGKATFAKQSSKTMSVRLAAIPADPNKSPTVLDRSYVQVVTADFNGDSSTLGDPIRSFAVGEINPLMVLRAPPVEFAAIDGSHPGYDKDGWIASAEVYDLSDCYAANGADTDQGECPMRTTYETDTTSETSLAVSMEQAWGLDTALKGGLSGGTHAPGGDCELVCYEATLELAYAHSEEQQTEAQQAKSFRYTAEQSLAPMQDRAFVATSDIEMSQVPVYFGTFTGGSLPPEPDLWTYSATPLDTVFSWVSVNDPQYGSVFAGPTPGNILSYPSSTAQVPTFRNQIVSIRKVGPAQVTVVTAGNHGYLCALPDNQQVQTAFPSSIGTDCAGQGEPVRIRGAGAFDGTDYVVSTIRTPTQVVLQKLGSQVPTSSDPCAAGGCTLSRQPSALPVQTQEIGPGTSGKVSFEFGQIQGYEERYAVSNGASAEAATSGETGCGSMFLDCSEREIFAPGAPGAVWAAHVKGEFEHNDSSMMNMVLESATTWTFEYDDASRPGSYRITPYLADDPNSGALTLTWTASPVGSSGLWGNPEWGYGAKGDPDLPARPDAAFSLPKLMEPYRLHTGLDDSLDVLLASPDFVTWACGDGDVCRPQAAVEVGQPLQISTTVHNYALTDLPASVSKPLVVRFYLGDPARGGYAITEEKITEPIPVRGQVPVQTEWTPPVGFAGQPGQPIYAVIDPNDSFEEVFDWGSPVVLWNRTLGGKVVSASSQNSGGSSTFVFRTDVDHGLALGDPVVITEMGDYNRAKAKVIATTPTSFTVVAKKSFRSVTKTGKWVSDQSENCVSNNPWYGDARYDFYNFGTGPEEFQSSCPTTNNEGYFLTPRIKGNRGGVERTDLSVRPDGIHVTKDGRAVTVDVRSSQTVYDAKIAVQVWVCGSQAQSCTPQLAATRPYQATPSVTISAGTTTRVKVPLTNTKLTPGSYRISTQVIPVSVWERPPGPGLYDVAMGQYANNHTITHVTVR